MLRSLGMFLELLCCLIFKCKFFGCNCVLLPARLLGVDLGYALRYALQFIDIIKISLLPLSLQHLVHLALVNIRQLHHFGTLHIPSPCRGIDTVSVRAFEALFVRG